MTTIDISLSRAHKIAERLKTRGNELFTEAFGLAKSTNVTGTTGESQIERLADNASRAMQLLELSDRFLRGAATVRAAISQQNAARGIDRLLCELDAVNRLLVHARSLHAEATQKSAVPLAELPGFKSLAADSAYSAGVDVQVLSPAQERALAARIEQLQQESFELTDRMAELNGPRLSFELDDELAAAVIGRIR